MTRKDYTGIAIALAQTREWAEASSVSKEATFENSPNQAQEIKCIICDDETEDAEIVLLGRDAERSTYGCVCRKCLST